MGFNGDLYPTAGATSVLSTKGDIVRYNTERERYGIGSAGQVLQVASSLPTWSTINLADSVLTTQGDVLYEGASALARLGQSTNNYTLATKGAGANPAWQASSTSTLTTTGDLLYASGANTLARLASVSSGQVLTSQGVGSAPAWATAGGGGSLEFIETITQASDAATFDVSLSTAYVYADYDHLVMTWNLQAIAAANNTIGLQMRFANSGTTFKTTDYFNIAIFVNSPDGLNKIFWSGNPCIPLLSDTTVGEGVNTGMTLNGQAEFYNNKLSDSGTSYWNKPFFYRSSCNQFNSYQTGVGYHEATSNEADLTAFQFAFYDDDFVSPAGTYQVAQNSTVSFWGVKNT